jgi:DNA polymerase III subunit delta'
VVPADAVVMARLAGFRSVRGHGAAVALLRRAVEGARVSSVYLFAGPAGVGKDRLAHALAQVMNCTARTADGDACGACVTCSKIARAVHPDLIVLQRELKDPPKDSPRDTVKDREETERMRTKRREEIPESELKPNITVEQIEELLTRMPFRPHEAATRWVIFRDAERLRPDAANKLLKTLEEPPKDTHFVLVTARPSALLSTIRSRCQTVRFGLLDASDVGAVLREGAAEYGLDTAHVDTLVGLGDGSVGRALEFKNQEAHRERQGVVDEILGALRAGVPGGYVTLGEHVKTLDRHDLDNVLLLLQRYFRSEALQHADAKPRQASANAARADIVRETQTLLDGSSNLNAQLVVESMLVRLREVRA